MSCFNCCGKKPNSSSSSLPSAEKNDSRTTRTGGSAGGDSYDTSKDQTAQDALDVRIQIIDTDGGLQGANDPYNRRTTTDDFTASDHDLTVSRIPSFVSAVEHISQQTGLPPTRDHPTTRTSAGARVDHPHLQPPPPAGHLRQETTTSTFFYQPTRSHFSSASGASSSHGGEQHRGTRPGGTQLEVDQQSQQETFYTAAGAGAASSTAGTTQRTANYYQGATSSSSASFRDGGTNKGSAAAGTTSTINNATAENRSNRSYSISLASSASGFPGEKKAPAPGAASIGAGGSTTPGRGGAQEFVLLDPQLHTNSIAGTTNKSSPSNSPSSLYYSYRDKELQEEIEHQQNLLHNPPRRRSLSVKLREGLGLVTKSVSTTATLQSVISSGEEEDFGFGEVKKKRRKFAFARWFRKKRISKEDKAKNFRFWQEMQEKRLKQGNPNVVLDYRWLKPLLDVLNADAGDASVDLQLNKSFASGCYPLFLFAGACPSGITKSMQAILFVYKFPTASSSGSGTTRRHSLTKGRGLMGNKGGKEVAAGIPGGGTIEFWWVKPADKTNSTLDLNLCQLHTSGKHKNSCGSQTKSGYEQIANYFKTNATYGDFQFGIEIVERDDGSRVPKAYLDRVANIETGGDRDSVMVAGAGSTLVGTPAGGAAGGGPLAGAAATTPGAASSVAASSTFVEQTGRGGGGTTTTSMLRSVSPSQNRTGMLAARGYISLIWQENWAAFMGRFIEGRLVYRLPEYEEGPNLRSREYHIRGSEPIRVRGDYESVPFENVFTDGMEKIKIMCEGVNWKTAPLDENNLSAVAGKKLRRTV
ncbi:unnamed protein product [Amoebophrya sp. A120]|nr:unnamed protein product [Amoebophrya sp. A120]|eukprot:GSA120T00012143001.1